jgi:hypothetical protein
MKLVELYGKVRYAVQIEEISRREAARRFGIGPRTVAKMLSLADDSADDHPSAVPALPQCASNCLPPQALLRHHPVRGREKC